MRTRRVALAALALVVAAATPQALAGKPPAKPKCGKGHRFCAGSATADITPPVTSPQFAYTFRHCAAALPADAGGHAIGAHEHVEEFAYFLAGGGPGCAGDKTNAELYSKTFPPSEGTYGRLQSNAFVLDDGRQRVAIVQADLGGIPGELHTRVAELTAPAGIDAEHLLISATHTHGSVGGIFAAQGYAALGGDLYDSRIFEAVAAGIAKSVVEAASRVQPARLAVGFGSIANANGNRSRDAWSLNPEALAGESADATRLMVMRVDTASGLPLGVVTNFTNHGVIHGTFNQYLSGDNQGQATRQVSRAIRARSGELPAGWEVVDTLTNGPAGDITPRSDDGGWTWAGYGSIEGPAFQEFAKMENAGSRQVGEAVRLWEELGPQLTSEVTLDARIDWVCLCGQAVGNDPHDPYDRESFLPNGAQPGFHADDPHYFGTSATPILGFDDGTREDGTLFPGHHHKRPRIVAAGPGLEPEAARVQLLRVNDVALATMPGEPTIQMGRRIERSVVAASGGLVSSAVLVGLANDYVSYMSTTQEYEAYRYEGSFSLWGQQTGNLFKERLVQLTGLMRDGAPVPACTRERGCLRSEPQPLTEAAPPRLLPAVQAGTAVTQPAATVERFTGTRFTWYGATPGAEWSPDDALVELQRREGDAWVGVTSDLEPEIPVRYDKRGPLHAWTAFFDPTKDQPTGTYRFVATGAGYTLASSPFEVVPSTALSLERSGAGWRVVHPAPDAAANFRYREKVSATATVSVPLAPGAAVPAGAIRDAWGNTNGIALTA